MIDIDKKYLKIIIDLLEKYSSESEVWIFGSRVSGKLKKYSDTDMVIIENNNWK